MIFHFIPIRSKLQLITLVTLIFWAIMALIYMDVSRENRNAGLLLEERSALISQSFALQNAFQDMLLEQQPDQVGRCLEHLYRLEKLLHNSEIHSLLKDGDEVQRLTGHILNQLNTLADQLKYPEEKIAEPVQRRIDSDGTSAGLSINDRSTHWNRAHITMDLLTGLISELNTSFDNLQELERKRGLLKLGLTLILGLFLTGTSLLLFASNLNKGFRNLVLYTHHLKEGKLPPRLDSSSGDEFGRIASNLNIYTEDLQVKIGYISSLAEEAPSAIYNPREEDELGKSLVVLSDYLTKKELEEVTRNREDKKQNWISEGMAQMGEILRSERENVVELSYRVIQKLVTYMNIEMGSLFITSQGDADNPVLELAASYAYQRRKYLKCTLQWGEGLPGTCAQERERIFLTEVPGDYFDIASGTGNAKPNCILLVPLKIDQEIYGVVELATVRLLRPFEISFVESLAESIASSLLAVRTSERTADLLKQSQDQADTLKQQEATMRENMVELEKAQEESSRKESEISGILQAINHSLLMAEMGLNGRFSSINDRFLMLLESHREQVVGKHHSEFAQVDAYSAEYKEFWSSLREGKSISNVEHYRLFSGKDVWLQQTFFPIMNSEGKVYKILNIAVDITENRMLQERLRTREQEITRSNLDMQTLHEAVNTSLIKCELDAEGIMMDVNDNYTEVTGYSRKELLGRNYRLFLKDTEKEQFEKIWMEVTKEKVYEGVMRRSKPTGEEVWLASTLSPVKDEKGIIYKVYFMGFDITEKKLKYQLLEDANHEIERLRERLKEFES